MKNETLAAPTPTGRPGDFDFLSGNWKIAHRRLSGASWDLFEDEASVHAILGGIGSVEELRIPARDFHGMGLRLLDVQRKLWADYWVNGRDGVMDAAPAWGSFSDGVGRWDVTGEGVVVRGVWDQITPHACRWQQLRSTDEGATWSATWVMNWQRA